MDGELGPLVEATRGPQPLRRIFHAVSGVAVAVVTWTVQPYPLATVLILAPVAFVLLVLDLARLRVPALNALFFRVFRGLASPREAAGIASSTWLVLGVLLTIVLFPRETAVPAILVLATADPAASFLGHRWGRRRLGTGSLEGAVVFVATATMVLSFWVSFPRAVAVAGVGAAAELMPWKVDDNLAIPVAVASGLWLVAG